MEEVNHVDKRNFDRNLANIRPCNPADDTYSANKITFYFLTLHLTHGFQGDREIIGEEVDVEGVPGIRPTGWADEDIDNV